jgi:dienelactone hydrolase
MIAPRRSFSLLLFAFLCVTAGFAAERTVDLTASDGTSLKATYFAAGRPGPGVLLLHQCNRQRTVWDGLARQLASAGINVLTMDYRGFGDSGGEPFDRLSPQQAMQVQSDKWPGDIDTAFHYLVSQPGVKCDIIAVGGASCGVQNSVQTARRHPEVKSLVLLSGTTDLSGRNFLRSSKTPVFFAVADDDEFQPTVVAIQWLYSLTATPAKRLVEYAQGGHGADMFAVHPELLGQITDWYVTTLIQTPGRAPASNQNPPISADVQTLDTIDQPGGAAKFAQQLQAARRQNPNATVFPEAIVNFIGYEHLQAGDNKGAIEILKLNALAYPKSPNVYDSLSDAYLADGQAEPARQNAQKALELLPSDTTDNEQTRNAIKSSAEAKLKQLGNAAH